MTPALLLLPALPLAGLALRRAADRRADAALEDRLLALRPRDPPAFDPAMLDGLPEAARRYLRFAIRPGAPLRTVARIAMGGDIGLGTRDAPGYRPMRASQVLAPPHGFVWRVDAGRGPFALSGADAASAEASWSRFWLAGLAPVARAGGGPDHARSAFGRMAAEAAFWTPAALLPGPHARWIEAGPDTARVELSRGALAQTVDIDLAADGRPIAVRIDRWSDANPERRYRLQPFGGTLDAFSDFDGFRLPTRIDGGNFFGTPDYFPFFRAEVTAIAFPT